MKVQSYVTTEDGKLFDVSFNTDEVTFKILEITEDEIEETCQDIKDQIYLLTHNRDGTKITHGGKESEIT